MKTYVALAKVNLSHGRQRGLSDAEAIGRILPIALSGTGLALEQVVGWVPDIGGDDDVLATITVHEAPVAADEAYASLPRSIAVIGSI